MRKFWRGPEDGGIKHETSGNPTQRHQKQNDVLFTDIFSRPPPPGTLRGLGRPERSPSFTDRRVSQV